MGKGEGDEGLGGGVVPLQLSLVMSKLAASWRPSCEMCGSVTDTSDC